MGFGLGDPSLDAHCVGSGEVDPLGNQLAELAIHLEGELLKRATFGIEGEVAVAEIGFLLDDRDVALLHGCTPVGWRTPLVVLFSGLSAFYSQSANLSCRISTANLTFRTLASHSTLLDARQSLPVSSKPPNSDVNTGNLYVGQLRNVRVHTPLTGGRSRAKRNPAAIAGRGSRRAVHSTSSLK